MLSLRFPEISATSGQNSDGIPLGVVDDSLLVAAVLVAKVIPIQKVLREDVTATGRTLADMTTAATDATAGDFAPFGALATMGLDDAFYFYVADGKECDTLHVQIATPGVGTWEIGIQEWDVVAESWVAMPIALDESNHFRSAAGVHKIKWTHTKKGMLKLHHTDAAKHVWHRVYIKAFTSATSAPVVSRLWAEDVAVSYQNVTTEANSGDWSTFASEFLPTLATYSMWVHPGLPIGAKVEVTAVRSASYTTIREYLATDKTWKAFPSFVDPSNDYSVLGTHRISYGSAADWTELTYQIDDAGGMATGWFERRRINYVVPQGPVALHKTKTRSLALGPDTAGGLYHKVAKTYYGITFTSLIAPTTDMALTFSSIAANGDVISRGVTWPANARNSWDVTGEHLAFTSPLTVPSGGQLMIVHAGGGSATDATITLVEG